MNTRDTVWLVVRSYAWFAALWALASFQLKNVALALIHAPDIASLVQLLATTKGVFMLLESIAGYRMLSRPENEQVAYLEIIKQRVC
ncbi:MAG: hypothetical protein ACK4SL_02405 [Candidatus Paceibacteria bacterium]